jgi:hypothetical protein
MISGIDMSSYYRIAQLSSSLDRFMTEITIAKAQLSSSMISGSGISINGIGSKIDIYA